MAHTAIKTIWKSTAIPQEVHDDGKMVAAMEKRPLGDILGEILQPVLKQRLKAGIKKTHGLDLQLKRQATARLNGGRK